MPRKMLLRQFCSSYTSFLQTHTRRKLACSLCSPGSSAQSAKFSFERSSQPPVSAIALNQWLTDKSILFNPALLDSSLPNTSSSHRGFSSKLPVKDVSGGEAAILSTDSVNSEASTSEEKIEEPQELTSKQKKLLDDASIKLFLSCSQNVDYKLFIAEFGCKDLFITWFTVTLLHVYLVLVRLNNDLNKPSFVRVRKNMLESFWAEVDFRATAVNEEWGLRVTQSKNIRMLTNRAYSTYLEYDEGLFRDDKALAGALWRNFYSGEAIDPYYLNKLVRYFRKQLHDLSRLPAEEILALGINNWNFNTS